MIRLILLFLLLCSPSFGAASWGTCTSTTGSGNSVSFSHTVSAGSNLGLFVGIATTDDTRTISAGPTFNGDATTLHESHVFDQGGGDAGLFTYKLANPDVGSFTVAATISGAAGSDDWVAFACNASGVDQSTPARAAVENGAVLNNASSLDVTNSETGDIVVGIVAVTQDGGENGTPAPHASQTSAVSAESDGLGVNVSYEPGASGTVTSSVTWTWNNQVCVHIAFAIKAAAGSAVPSIVFTEN